MCHPLTRVVPALMNLKTCHSNKKGYPWRKNRTQVSPRRLLEKYVVVLQASGTPR